MNPDEYRVHITECQDLDPVYLGPTECAVNRGESVTALSKRSRVVVGIQEGHVPLALSEKVRTWSY